MKSSFIRASKPVRVISGSFIFAPKYNECCFINLRSGPLRTSPVVRVLYDKAMTYLETQNTVYFVSTLS